MIPKLIGTLLALVALAFVLYPLFREPLGIRPSARSRADTRRVATAVDALREIEFDHATGKLSERDYAELKASYTRDAIAAMRTDANNGVICGTCGPRPEADATFCSACGRALAA
jgi:cytochrome c-type biogenesis protein CcmI